MVLEAASCSQSEAHPDAITCKYSRVGHLLCTVGFCLLSSFCSLRCQEEAVRCFFSRSYENKLRMYVNILNTRKKQQQKTGVLSRIMLHNHSGSNYRNISVLSHFGLRFGPFWKQRRHS